MMAKKFKLSNGVVVELYPICVLAEELGRTSQTVTKWEVAGILSKPTFRDKNGRRMYSREQIDTIVRIAEECNIRQGYSVSNTSFPSKVHEALAEVNKKYFEEPKDEQNK